MKLQFLRILFKKKCRQKFSIFNIQLITNYFQFFKSNKSNLKNYVSQHKFKKQQLFLFFQKILLYFILLCTGCTALKNQNSRLYKLWSPKFSKQLLVVRKFSMQRRITVDKVKTYLFCIKFSSEQRTTSFKIFFI